MQLELKREMTSERGTEGRLALNGVFHFFTLEPPEWVTDSRGITSIPPGVYEVALTYSPRFRRIMPLVTPTPGRQGIRIHWGNYEACTDGCILVGMERGPVDEVWNSRAAFDGLFSMLQQADQSGEGLSLEILPAPPPATEV